VRRLITIKRNRMRRKKVSKLMTLKRVDEDVMKYCRGRGGVDKEHDETQANQ
jgi:hypothetical protein